MAQLPKAKLPIRRITVEKVLDTIRVRGISISQLWRYSRTLLPSGQSLKDFILELDDQGGIRVLNRKVFLV